MVVSSPFPFLEGAPLAFAHRGGAGDWPENTMPAFEGAVALGFRHLETDAHLTSDGVLLAFHDDVLDRVTDRVGVIAELPYAEVRLALVDGREPIPLVEDLLTAWPDVFINIDPKHDQAVEPLTVLLTQMGIAERVCIGSFSDDRLARARALVGPALCTSLGPADIIRQRWAANNGTHVDDIPAPCLQVPTTVADNALVDEAFVECAHDHDLQVHVWTIDEADEMTRLLDLGVDGIMTDRPAVLKGVLGARGEWHGRVAEVPGIGVDRRI
jgi:glycerophosphoryl diester phosphodiesterase